MGLKVSRTEATLSDGLPVEGPLVGKTSGMSDGLGEPRGVHTEVIGWKGVEVSTGKPITLSFPD